MKFLKDESGQAVVLMASFLSILALGFLALALDMGYFFHQKRMVQAAADAAVMAAAEESSAGNAAMLSAAQAAARLNGFDSSAATNPATVVVNSPPTMGSYATSSSYTEAIVTMPVPTLVLGAFNHGMTKITVAARAVAGGSSSTCIMGLSSTGYLTSSAPENGYPGVYASVATSNGASLTSSNCSVCGNGASGSAVTAEGGGSINALSIISPGGDYTGNGGTINSTNGVSQSGCTDPYSGKLTAPAPGSCIDPTWMSAGTAGGQAKSISPGTYCNFNTSNVSTLTLSPGTYIITQNFSTNSGTTINGTGVTFYFANGAKAGSNSTNPAGGGADGVKNGSTLTLTAPTSGSTKGLLFWDGNSSSSTPDTFTFGGGASSNLTGAIYAPKSNLQMGNGTNTGTFDGLIVGYTVLLQGGSTVTNSATSSTLASLGVGGAGRIAE